MTTAKDTKPKAEPKVIDNLSLWEQVREVPKNAQKPISGGRLKGMTDISPMWRLKMLTDLFGSCGTGWKTEIQDRWSEQSPDGQISVFVTVGLYYRLADGTWSDAVAGLGGNKLVDKENAGLYTSDESYKMAYTDAISVCCKMLGFGADIYWSKDGESKYNKGAEPTETKATPRTTSAKTPERPTTTTTPPVITMEQAKRLYAMSKSDAAMCKEVMGTFGYTSAKDILRKDYDEICATVVEKVAEKEAFPEFNDDGLPF